MRIFKWIFLILFILVPSFSSGIEKDFMPYWNFYTGQGFLEIRINNPKIPDVDQFYVAGLCDGLNLMSSDDPRYHWFIKCTYQKRTRQLTEIFRKWLEKNPKRWHEPASILFMDAIRETCK